jgi:hypothetical protein
LGRSTKRAANLCFDYLWAIVNVARGKTQESESCIDEQVLAAVVFDQAVPVIPTVVLENESRSRVIEVGPADKSTFVVAEVRLNFGAR